MNCDRGAFQAFVLNPLCSFTFNFDRFLIIFIIIYIFLTIKDPEQNCSKK